MSGNQVVEDKFAVSLPRISKVLLMVITTTIARHEVSAFSVITEIAVPAPRTLASWIPMKPVATWPAVKTTVGFEVKERPLLADTASWSFQR